MKTITVRYTGECRKCSAELAVGIQAIHEKRVGLFCLGCAPTDPEDIRAYRQAAADRRADMYEEWAEKRETKAHAALNSHMDIRRDIAFITQPGHIPFRARMIAADDRAYQSLNTADRFRGKAESLRNGVRVKGDKERYRQAKREAALSWIKVGMRVDTVSFGLGTVAKINKKTATITNTGASGTARFNVDLSWLKPVANWPITIAPESKTGSVTNR